MLRRMKRPPGLWLLLSAGVLCLCFKDVSSVRATALIFAKSTTTTSTTVAPKDGETSANEEGVTEESALNVTKSLLTGIPQLDYIHDPNLPRELNGYNLTEYPFYDRLPPAQDIDFKCDGLHDGFYASVLHKCQVYHHCLYGTRYDFLCANYTAFDQKTFICHFVSEVDCVNSKNFWHRNDALYETTTTTTVKPIISSATGGGGNRKPSTSNGRRRRPYRRRRPQYDYYEDEEEADDYYDDEPRYQVTPESSRPRNKRPRPRPRPIYDDEYEYEQERYDRRGDKRRGMYDDRRRYKEDRRKYDDEYEDEIEDTRFDGGSEDRVRTKDSDRKRRPDSADNPRYEGNDKGSRRRKPTKNNDDHYEEDKERPNRKGASKDPIEDRPIRKPNRENDDAQKSSSNGEKRTRRPNNNKPKDDYYPDEDEPAVEQRSRTRQTNKESASGKKSSRDHLNEPKDSPVDEESSSPSRKINDNPPEGVPLVKPSSGSSIYDRPRAAPKIRPPVPKNEQDKYSYKTSTIKPVNGKVYDEEYYDEYEEQEPLPKRPSNKPKNEESRRPYNNNKQGNDRPRETTKMSASRQRNHSRRPNYDQEEVYQRERPLRNKNVQQDRNRKRPVVEYDEEYEDVEKPTKEVVSSKPSRSNGDRFKDDRLRKNSQSPSSTSGSTTTTTRTPEVTTKAPEKKDKAEPAVRIIKRPFLPSRGGSPFAARGLLPVGSKALLQPPLVQSQPIDSEPLPKSPLRIQIQPNQSQQTQSQTRQQQSYAQINKIPLIERNPLDIKEDEYDVTLNDALNPTLPNLPVRNFPTSAFSSPANDYTYGQFRRAPQRDYAEPQVSHSQKQPIRYPDIPQQGSQRYQTASESQRYQTVERQQDSVQLLQSNQKRFPLPESQSVALNQRLSPQPQPQKYEPAPSTFSTKNNREQLVNSNSDYRAQFTHAVPVTYQFRTGPRVTHMQHTQPFYTTF